MQKSGANVTPPDVKLIARYVEMSKKKVSVKEMGNFLASVKKAVDLDKTVTPSSTYGKELVNVIQEKVAKTYNTNIKKGGSHSVALSPEQMDNYKEIINGKKEWLVARFLRRYLYLVYTKTSKSSAQSLLKSINYAKKMDLLKYQPKELVSELEKAHAKIKAYVEKGTPISAGEKGLAGYDHLEAKLEELGCMCQEKKNSNLGSLKKKSVAKVEGSGKTAPVKREKPPVTIYKAHKLRGLGELPAGIKTMAQVKCMKHELLPFTGEWKEILGTPAKNFKLMIYGMPKNGKTYFSLTLADYLQKYFGQVLYITPEENDTATMTSKANELKLHDDILITDKVPNDLSIYDFIFIDSVTRAGIDIEGFEKLKEVWKDKAFILVSQVNKNGQFRGSQEWTHNVDSIAEVKEGIVNSYGRFTTGQSEMDIFQYLGFR